MPNLSWGDAFETAAKVEPEELGDDFLARTAPSTHLNSDGESRISKVAQSFLAKEMVAPSNSELKKRSTEEKKEKKKKKRKADKAPDEGNKEVSNPNVSKSRKKKKKEKSHHAQDEDQNEDTIEENPLEGRVINGDTIVLVDKSSGKVFSGLDRGDDGNHLHIGSIDSSDEITLFPKSSPTDLDENSKEEKDTIEKEEFSSPIFPYPTDSDDHCETPQIAYEHIIPLLGQIRKSLGKEKPENLAIYDPYFCDGSVVTKLAAFGYSNVYNKKEDCYKVWEEDSSRNKLPPFDVFVTNPPYSGDHIDRLMQFITSSSVVTTNSRPWCLLMPNWVHKKDYYLNSIKEHNIQPFYLVPKKRYVYEPPKDFRAKKASSTHKKSSPFVSMWYIWGGSKKMNDILYNECLKRGGDIVKKCDVARSRSALRDLRRGGKGKKKK